MEQSLAKACGRKVARLGIGWAAYHGDVGDSILHAHRALQVCVAEGARVIVDLGENTICAPSIVIKIGVKHALREESGVATVLYFDPDCPIAIGLNNACRGESAAALDVMQYRAIRKLARRLFDTGDNSENAIAAFNNALDGAPKIRIHDKRAETVLSILAAEPSAPWRLPELANIVELSPHNLAAAVKAMSGLSIRAHIRWMRIRLALRAAAAGEEMSAAAEMAGFSSVSQFTYSFREMFGMSPSTFISCFFN